MRRLILFVLLLAVPRPALAQTDPFKALARASEGPALTVPAEVKADVGGFAVVSATTDGKSVKFVPLDLGLNRFPPELLVTKKAAVFYAARAGRYRVLCYTAVGDEPSEPAVCVVVFGDVPPGPGPGPGPTPPPKPDDGALGLIKASREGAAKVASANKATEARALAAKNRSLASAIAAGGVVDPMTGQFSAAAALAEWRVGNNAAVDAATWRPWADAVSPALQTLYKAGKLPTKTEWAAAFNEIADGLEGK